ncbi:hypothetical protein AAG906_022699 [Vitis piasezkii]
MCIDYRALNKVTVKNKYPILLIANLFDQLGRVRSLETPRAIYTKPLVGKVWKLLKKPRDVHTSIHYGGRHEKSPRLSREF